MKINKPNPAMPKLPQNSDNKLEKNIGAKQLGQTENRKSASDTAAPKQAERKDIYDVKMKRSVKKAEKVRLEPPKSVGVKHLDEIKQKIARNEYFVSTEKIVEKLLK